MAPLTKAESSTEYQALGHLIANIVPLCKYVVNNLHPAIACMWMQSVNSTPYLLEGPSALLYSDYVFKKNVWHLCNLLCTKNKGRGFGLKYISIYFIFINSFATTCYHTTQLHVLMFFFFPLCPPPCICSVLMKMSRSYVRLALAFTSKDRFATAS